MLTLIAAMTPDRVIGASYKKGMLWYNKVELQHFRNMTIGKTCIVGRRTAEQMPVLTGRNMLCLSNHYYEQYPNINLSYVLERYADSDDEVMVIGGGEIYKLLLPHANKLIISIVDVAVEGDVFFPKIRNDEWRLSETMRYPQHGFNVKTYKRR